MGCSSCGCGGPCGCGCTPGCSPINASDVILNPIPVAPRPCSPLNPGCGTALPATPTPYYNCTPQCQENHCQEIINNFFSASICTIAAFTMPACSGIASVTFPGVKVLPVGAYLWNETYGYLEVTSFNNRTGLATLLNHCNEGNAAVGTNIPGCTCFVVTDPPQEGQVNPFVPYLAENFTAPADGDCTTITVTTTAGLIVGGEITLASGIYVLDSILTPTTIVICNEGQGITPGTVVLARNEAGQLQYPIVTISNNPCSQDPIQTGSVVVCEGGVSRKLTGDSVGQVLTLLNTTSGLAEYQDAPLDPCNNGSSPEGAVVICFDADPMVLSGLTEGDVLVLTTPGNNGAAYVNSGLVGSTQLTTPEAFALAPGATHLSPVLSLVITNPNPHKIMQILQNVALTMQFTTVLGSDPFSGSYGIEFQIDGGGYATMINFDFSRVASGDAYGLQAVAFNVNPLAVLASITLDFRGYLINTGGGGSDSFDIEDFTLNLSHIAIGI